MGSKSYNESIAEGLDDALKRAIIVPWDIGDTPIVIFSDLHRGQDDHADDFRKCKTNYHRALDFYFDSRYALVVLGDSEELWEGRPRKVVPIYEDSFKREARFHQGEEHRYFKVWGNHDDLWQYPSKVAKHLAMLFGALPVPEGLDMKVKDGDDVLGRIFLVHGHQGTPGSDKLGKLSRHVVRWVWRPIQRLFKISLTTPATSFDVRGKHDRAMYEWAAGRNDLVLIAGHTHRPVFVSKPHVETIERIHAPVTSPVLESVSPEQSEERQLAEREIAWAKAESGSGVLEAAVEGRDRPCYFNTGCCSFSNGDVTGIEIADGEIRLVRWSADIEDPADRVLETHDLRDVFAGLGG